MSETRTYTVSQLTREIRFLLEDSLSDIWVEGEISNYKVYSSGHAYFSIKDKESVLNCVMFKGHAIKVSFEPQDGLSVLCRGRISVYEKRGQYQFYVEVMEPRGKGALQLAFEQLKDKLGKEGLFSDDRKRGIPLVPKHLGVVTSASGAAIRDILTVAHRRFDNMRITVYPVKVQGDRARQEIADGIRSFNDYNEHIKVSGSGDCPVDVLIVGRGGGSLEDLWAFNEEEVARAVAASDIPVISAVGHEVDFTICDFVADLRAATPSAAAEIAVPRKRDLVEKINEHRETLNEAIKEKIKVLDDRVSSIRKSYVLRNPLNFFLQLEQQIDDFSARIVARARHVVEIKSGHLGRAAAKLGALSPLAVLERGYSITFKSGAVARTASVFKKGDLIKTKLADGEVDSRVETIRKQGTRNTVS